MTRLLHSVEMSQRIATLFSWLLGTAVLYSTAGASPPVERGAKSLPVSPSGQVSPHVLKLALLIGIDDYQSPDVPDLHGCVNDVTDMRNLLVDSFGFSKDGVRCLTDKEATHEGILKAFREHLLQQAQPQSRVVIHFSGHSSQMKDVSGDETTDHLDETIVPYDSRMPGKFDLTDDEIADLLRQLREITEHCLVVFDSTYSFQDLPEAVKRHAVTQARDIKADPRDPPAPAGPVEAGGGDRAELGELTRTYGTIVACDANEMAHEITIRGRVRGALTYFLVEELRHGAAVRDTYLDVADAVRTKVGIVLPGQSPQFDGRALNSQMFALGQRDISTTVVAFPDNDVVQLWTAQPDQITAGSIFGLHPLNAADTQNAPQAIVRVEPNPAGRSATARYVRGTPLDGIVLAVEQEHVFPPFSLPIYLEDEFDSHELDELRTAWCAAPALKPTEKWEDAAVMVRRRRGKFEVAGIDAAGQPTEFEPVADVDSAVKSLKSRAIWTNLAGLQNPYSPLTVRLSATASEKRDGDLRPIGVLDAQYVDGETVNVSVTNESNEPLYVCVANFSSDLSVQMIFPTDGQPRLLPPGESIPIENIRMFFPAGSAEARNRLRLFAFRQPINAWLALNQPDAAVPTPVSPLQHLFCRAVLREVGDGALRVPVDQWATQTYDFDVIRREGPYLRAPFSDKIKTISVHSPVTGERVAKIVEFKDGRGSRGEDKRWIVFDAMGRYDASDDEAAEQLVWKVGDELIAFDQLKSRYYDPGLFDKYVGVSSEPLRPVGWFSAPELFPDVDVAFLEPNRSRFRITLRPRDSGMGKVVVKLNGKQVTDDAAK